MMGENADYKLHQSDSLFELIFVLSSQFDYSKIFAFFYQA